RGARTLWAWRSARSRTRRTIWAPSGSGSHRAGWFHEYRAIALLFFGAGKSPSARRLAGARLFPVDEQEPARRVELWLARPRQNLQLQLLDLVLRAIPAGESEIAVAPGARQQHHVHRRV